jgi:RHS repeat-associated protein
MGAAAGDALSLSNCATTAYQYNGIEHVDDFDLNVNMAMYRTLDPVIGRWWGVDPKGEDYASWTPYNSMGNSPMVQIDPNGDALPFLALVGIGAAVFGAGNLATQAAAGQINSFGDGLEALGSGAVAGAVLTAGVTAGLGVPILGTILKGAGIAYGGTLAAGILSGIGHGIFGGDWSVLGNSLELFAGNFYLDGNRGFFGQTLQGLGRFSWELPQSTIGHGYSQLRNAIGGTDRVDYFGGVTFSTGENRNSRNGVSIGNHININIRDGITTSFEDRVVIDPLFMHEYGHTFQSQIWGPAYLLGIGIPSLASAAFSVPGMHRTRWYERQANRFAARYFGRNYGVNWSPFDNRFPR